MLHGRRAGHPGLASGTLDAKRLQRFGRHTDPSVDRHGKTLHQSLDTSILDLADDIAYGVHDLEDAVALKLYTREQWQEIHQSLDPNWVSRMELTNLEDDLFEKNHLPVIPANRRWERWFMH